MCIREPNSAALSYLPAESFGIPVKIYFGSSRLYCLRSRFQFFNFTMIFFLFSFHNELPTWPNLATKVFDCIKKPTVRVMNLLKLIKVFSWLYWFLIFIVSEKGAISTFLLYTRRRQGWIPLVLPVFCFNFWDINISSIY